MNREMWMRILTVAVVAPYLYKLSGKETGYFSIGLKLLAGGLIAVNIKPLLLDAEVLKRQAQTVVANLAKAHETLEKQNAARTVIDTDNVSDGEYTSNA